MIRPLALLALALPLGSSLAACRTRVPEPGPTTTSAAPPATAAPERRDPPPTATPSSSASPSPSPAEPGSGAAATAVPSEPPAATPPARHPALLDPSLATERAPARFTARLVTAQGNVDIDVERSWAPLGADRFFNLVRIGYFDDVAFFRVIEGFMAQAGIHGDPAVNRAWRGARIEDDPAGRQSNRRGMVSFATAGPGTRTTQFFINLVDNGRLDGMGFAPFGRVRDMSVVERLFAGYGEGAPGGMGPAQGRIQSEGNAYLRASFPRLDFIVRAQIL